MTANAPGRPTIIHNVQALRSVAAMSAVMAHLMVYLHGAFGLTIPPGGVDLFFVISGYVMVYTSTGSKITPRKFMARRITRIVPLYWAITFFVFGLAAVAPQLVQTTSADLGELLKSLFFIPFEKRSGVVQPTLFVGWTLNFEMLFYILFAGSLLLRNDLLRNLLVMAALIAIVVWGQIFPSKDPIIVFMTMPLLLNFVFGMLIGMLTPHVPAKAPKGALTAVLILGALGMIVQFTANLAFPEAESTLTCGLPSAILIAALVVAERWGWRITSPTVILLGDATYAIYLTHPFVTVGMEKLTANLNLNPIGNFIAMIVTMAIAAVVGILVYRYVETPLNGLARRVRLPGYVPSTRPQPAAPAA